MSPRATDFTSRANVTQPPGRTSSESSWAGKHMQMQGEQCIGGGVEAPSPSPYRGLCISSICYCRVITFTLSQGSYK